MISAFLLAASFSINTLPDVTHIDGEISTNIVLNISSKLSEFSLDLSFEATLFELLVAIDNLLKTNKKLQIDLVASKIILVKSVLCAHCGRQIPIYEPLSKYVPVSLRCGKCEDTCVHSYESSEPIIKTITKYSFSFSKTVLNSTLKKLGILPGTELSVLDHDGKIHKIVL